MKEEITVQAPGRINIIGEHTDYNGGFVLPAAIDKKVIARIRLLNSSEPKTLIAAKDKQEEVKIDLENIERQENGSWKNYLLGVLDELQKAGGNIENFEAEFSGEVPPGSGMSSSAALECAFTYGLDRLFDLRFENLELIKIAHRAEHYFVGIKCGIMDQYTSIMGKKGHCLLLDCHHLSHEYIPLQLHHHQFVLINTNVTHSLVNSEYNTRREECQEGVHIIRKYYPAVHQLRDVELQQLKALQREMPEIIYNRCLHVIEENSRVLAAVSALKQNDLHHVGELMYHSHMSLKNLYEVSCKELDFLVEEAQNWKGVLGARMMGGGFGGCTINLVEVDVKDDFISSTLERYQQTFDTEATPYEVTISEGAGLLDEQKQS